MIAGIMNVLFMQKNQRTQSLGRSAAVGLGSVTESVGRMGIGATSTGGKCGKSLHMHNKKYKQCKCIIHSKCSPPLNNGQGRRGADLRCRRWTGAHKQTTRCMPTRTFASGIDSIHAGMLTSEVWRPEAPRRPSGGGSRPPDLRWRRGRAAQGTAENGK